MLKPQHNTLPALHMENLLYGGIHKPRLGESSMIALGHTEFWMLTLDRNIWALNLSTDLHSASHIAGISQ